jgi:AraC family transcriptional regulator
MAFLSPILSDRPFAPLPSATGLARYFHLPYAPSLSVRCRRSGLPMTVTRLRQSGPGGNRSAPPEPEDAFLILLQMKPSTGVRHWQDGVEVTVSSGGAGALYITQLIHRPQWQMASAYDALAFRLPRAALNAVAPDLDGRAISGLHCPGGGIDGDAYRLAACLLPALDSGTTEALFVEHVVLALRGHLAQRYGQIHRDPPVRGGLSPRQERLAREMLAAPPPDGSTLEEVAEALGLSRAHFIRAFRISVGDTPYQWQMAQRLERARRLLAGTEMPLVDIALSCGFSDQSHFTRVFALDAGTPPGAWRRTMRC